ncbi:MAG: penicillin-binding transpeptidase domain-containing protein [Myxococcota bacterium]
MRKGFGGGRTRASGGGLHRLRIGRNDRHDRGGRPLIGLDGRHSILASDARWRHDQRARKRRLTARGRATLLAFAGFVLLCLSWWVEPFRTGGSAHALASLPPVGAGAPQPPAPQAPAAIAPDPAPAPLRTPVRVPGDLLERLPVTRTALDLPATDGSDARSAGHLLERVTGPGGVPLEVEYTLDAELMRHVFSVLRRGRVALGNVVVMEPTTGRVLAYASTDPERFPPTRHYPAASLVKVITAAAAMHEAPRLARLPCRYTGSPYRLTPSRIDPPARGNTVSLRRALATSNNQCLAQLAVHALGTRHLMAAIDRFGWLDSPAPAHAAGQADPGEEPYDLGKLGSGLAGSRITPLHAAQLAAVLVHGELVSPRWVESVVELGGARELEVPAPSAPRRVLSPGLTRELRDMLVDTTRNGTARRAFRGRGGHPLLGPVKVAGKTGSLSGKAPDGRYEWFIGVAPADSPRVAIASVVVQDDLFWRTSSQIAADVLRGVFCEGKRCSPDKADRFIQVPKAAAELARTGSEGAGSLN